MLLGMIALKKSNVHYCPFQERGLSLYEDQEIKDEDGESSTTSLRDAVSLAVPDETHSGMQLLSSVCFVQIEGNDDENLKMDEQGSFVELVLIMSP